MGRVLCNECGDDWMECSCPFDEAMILSSLYCPVDSNHGVLYMAPGNALSCLICKQSWKVPTIEVRRLDKFVEPIRSQVDNAE